MPVKRVWSTGLGREGRESSLGLPVSLRCSRGSQERLPQGTADHQALTRTRFARSLLRVCPLAGLRDYVQRTTSSVMNEILPY